MAFVEPLAAYTTQFGTDATFDGDTTVRGIFAQPYADPLDVSSNAPRFLCVEADVPAPVGKTLEVDAITYTIVASRADGIGMVSLQLEQPDG